jgi:mutator protein MutT
VHVVAAVVLRDGRALLCRRPRHKRHGGLWEFPGGKLLAGETLGGAAKRELAEELQLELSEVRAHLGSRRDPGSAFVIHFVEVAAAGEPVSLEHEDVAWVQPRDLGGYDLAPGDRAFVQSWSAASAD